MQNKSIVAHLSLDVLRIQYWKLRLACPGISDHIHINGLNLIDGFMYVGSHTKNQLNISTYS